MKVNVDKFQLIIFGKYDTKRDAVIKVDGNIIESQNVVKLLDLYADYYLSFDVQVDEICRKAGRKLNVLARLSKVLNVDCKLVLFYAFYYVAF